MTAEFIPLIVSTLSLALASFFRNKNWIIVAFVLWISLFFLTILVLAK